MSPALNAVVTIEEAAYLFDRNPDTIKYHILRGQVVWRKLGGEKRGLYLIELASLVRLYGQPIRQFPS